LQDTNQIYNFPDGKRYNSFVGYYKRKYGERLQKLVLDAGFTCPNRDGTVGRGGCTYCDNAAFHPNYSTPQDSLTVQLDKGIEFHQVRYRNSDHYLAYFQSFSNTYASLERLNELYLEVLQHPQVVGIVVGTRPDCIDEEKLDYFKNLQEGNILKGWKRKLTSQTIEAPIVTIEYGIESCYDSSLLRINRGHDFDCARKAVQMTHSRGIDVGAHFILGLPGETRQMLIDQCEIVNSLPLHSVKFHQLQFVKGTKMKAEFEASPEEFLRYDLDDYLDLIVDILERLRPDLYIERVAGEVPPRFVDKPQWGLIRNFQILHLLDQKLETRNSFQGRLMPNKPE